MKLSRNTLLIIIACMGIFLIGYGVLRHFTGIGFSEGIEKYLFDIIIFGALGLFMYNRKLVKDEKVAREAKEEEERRAAEGTTEPEEETGSTQDEDLPHWERRE